MSGDFKCLSCDAANYKLMEKAKNENIETVWDRAEAMQPQCGFGEMGLCCTNCSMGPCRIVKVSEDGPKKGICGADEDTIAARNLARAIAAGSAATRTTVEILPMPCTMLRKIPNQVTR